MKKSILRGLFTAVGAALLLSLPTLAADEAVVIYTNDTHTYLGRELTFSKIAAYRDSFENALLVDAGDHIQGTAYGGMDNGASITAIMNASGYDAATLGNHEFDYGMQGCLDTIERAEFPYLSCSFHHVEDGVRGDNVLDAYRVFEVNGIKLAIVGISTPQTIKNSAPTYFQDHNGEFIYGFDGGDDGSELYKVVQQAIDAASKEADYVIALGHLGLDPSGIPWTSEDVIANTSGLDAFIDGHSHSTVEMREVADKDGNTVILTQTGYYFAACGKLTISADGSITTELISADELASLEPDSAVAELESAWMTEVDAILGEKIAESDLEFTISYPDGTRAVRSGSTNLTDFTADAYLWYMLEREGLDCDFALINGGGVRSAVNAGDWSYNTCKTVNPFGNVLCMVGVTGQDLLDLLEFGARFVGIGESGTLMHFAGLSYEVNPLIESTVKVDDMGLWTGAPEVYRVTNVRVYDRASGKYLPLELDKSYTMAGTNYTLRNRGGGCEMLGETRLVKDYIIEDYLALAAYAMAFDDLDGDGYSDICTSASPLMRYAGYEMEYENRNGTERIRQIADTNAVAGVIAMGEVVPARLA